MTLRSWTILAVFLCLLAGVRAAAQTPDTAVLQGTVIDPAGHPVAHATTVLVDKQSGVQRTQQTDGQGRSTFAGLPVAGRYDLYAHVPGFAPAHLGPLELVAGSMATARLQLSIGSNQARITVTGAQGEVRTDEPQLGERLGRRQMEDTPLLNRRITYLPLLDAANRPALNQGDAFMDQDLFNTNGSGRRQTWFELDGSSGNDSWGRQTIFTNVPLAAIEEMTVLENAFSAQYGFGLGGVVNMVTRSGGPQWHGDLLGLWRPSGPEAELSGFTAATAANGNEITNDTLYQAAASLSGPVDRRRDTQIFLSTQYSAEDRASPVTSPIAPGNFVGKYRSWLAFLRLDHTINGHNNFFLRSTVDRYEDTNPNGTVGGNNLPSVDRIFHKRTYSQELGETWVMGPSLLNDLRMQFQLASPITQFAPVVYGTQFEVPISTGGVFISGTSQSALLLNHQYEVNDVVTMSKGRRQVAFGGDIIQAHSGGNSKEYGGPMYDGQFIYNPCTLALSVCESAAYLDNIQNVQSYTQSYGNANYLVNDTQWAVFVQEDLHAMRAFTLNLGLRYERQSFTDAREDLAPRVGFSYDVRGRGKTVLQAGFGVYYAQVVDNSEANYALTGPTGVFNYTAGPGQIGFPDSVQAAPLPAFPAGAVAPLRSLYVRPGRGRQLGPFFPTSTLRGYPDKLLNPYNQQWTLGVQQQLPTDWAFSANYIGSHTLRNVRPLDVDPPAPFVRTAQGQFRTPQAANCTRPYWTAWYQEHGMTCNPDTPTVPGPPYAVIQSDVNDGYVTYEALDVGLSHPFHKGLSMLASYDWFHTIDNVDPDVPGQNPNDPNFTGKAEKGNAIYDQRQRFVLSGTYAAAWRTSIGGVATFATGLPYNFVTGSTNSGDLGATTDRPVIHGVVVGRNTGRGKAIEEVDPYVEHTVALGAGRLQARVRAEAFNVLNHANFVGYSGTYGNGPAPGPGFGAPLPGITNQMTARVFQFSSEIYF